MIVICNLIAEKVHELFPNINILINNNKKVFLKSPSRISIFNDEMEIYLYTSRSGNNKVGNMDSRRFILRGTFYKIPKGN